MTFKTREQRGVDLLKDNAVKQVKESEFVVRSQSEKEKKYSVCWAGKNWTCDCEDFSKTGRKCKHLYAIQYYQRLRVITTAADSLSNDKNNNGSSCPKCRYCDSSKVIKRGFRYSRKGPTQRYFCANCERRFAMDLLTGSRNEVGIIVIALDLYFRGLSFRQVSEHLNTCWQRKVSPTTVMRWIARYVQIIHKFLSSKPGKVRSERWAADETLVKLEGRHILFWTLLDEGHRYLLALEVSRRRDVKQAKKVLTKGKRLSQLPDDIVTDGASYYPEAVDELFRRSRKAHVHISGPGLTAGVNNNKVERLHRTLKKRIKVMGAFRKMKSAKTFANGFRIHHNFISPHRSLSAKTPAEAAGVVDHKMTWHELLESSVRQRKLID